MVVHAEAQPGVCVKWGCSVSDLLHALCVRLAASCLAFSTSAARCLSARAACPEGWLISYLTLPALVLVAV